MAINTLLISDVDLDQLERQRVLLNQMLDALMESHGELVTPEQVDALVGVMNMLDEWSDEVYFSKEAR